MDSLLCSCINAGFVSVTVIAVKPVCASAPFQPIPSLPSAAKRDNLSTPTSQKVEKDGESNGKGK